jgi:hypothetical protein
MIGTETLRDESLPLTVPKNRPPAQFRVDLAKQRMLWFYFCGYFYDCMRNIEKWGATAVMLGIAMCLSAQGSSIGTIRDG